MSALSASTLATLLATCAPQVHPATMGAIISVESKGDALALHVNGLEAQPERALDESGAALVARRFIAKGFSVDIGLSQLNSKNLPRLGLTPEQAFDQCINVAAGALILEEGYDRGVAEHGEGQRALQAALSAYNTGSTTRGLRNGYVARVYGSAFPVTIAAAGPPSAVQRRDRRAEVVAAYADDIEAALQ